MKKTIKLLAITALCLALVFSSFVVSANAYVKNTGNDTFMSTKEATKLDDIEYIIVLGCLVSEDGTPCNVLKDRLDKAVELYNAGVAPKIIMSGDHSSDEYNEVGAMKQYAIDKGVPAEDILMDHSGFSTYETMYRAKEVFKANRAVIVTQEYHLYRCVYIARKLGIDAYGVASDYTMHESREVLARCKDFVTTIYKPQPTDLDNKYPVIGDFDIAKTA